MESVYLKTFLEVVRTGSITKAAENLCVSQPAVSRRIKFMEIQYDCRLLNRGDALLTATAFGKVLQEKAKQILTLEQDLLSEIKRTTQPQRLTFACTPTFGSVHLPKIQKNLIHSQTELNELNFTLGNPEEILNGLKDARYDLAVIEHCQDYDLEMLHTISLPDDDVVFVTSKAFDVDPLENPLEQLFQLTLFGRNDGCCSRKLLEKNLGINGRQIGEFRRILAFDDFHSIINSLIDGDGVAFLSKDLINKHPKRKALNSFHLPGFIHTRKRTLVLSDHLHDNKINDTFINLVLDHLQPQLTTVRLTVE